MKNVEQPLNIVRIKIKFPTLTADQKFKIIDDSLTIIFYENYIVYRTSINHIVESELLDSKGNVVKQNISNQTISYQYYIYKKEAKTGILYDSLTQVVGKTLNVSDYKKKRFIVNDKLLHNENDSLIQMHDTENLREEKYFKKVKNSSWESDTSYFYYSKQFNGVDFSFSPKLDSIAGKKLVKVVLKYNPDFQNKEVYFRYPREIILEMKEGALPENEIKEIIKCIKSNTVKAD